MGAGRVALDAMVARDGIGGSVDTIWLNSGAVDLFVVVLVVVALVLLNLVTLIGKGERGKR
jgi:hypothetical protein